MSKPKLIYKSEKPYQDDINDLIEKGGVGSGVRGHTTNRPAYSDKKTGKMVPKEEYLKDTASKLMGQSGYDDKPGHFMSRRQVANAIGKVTGHPDSAAWMILEDMERAGRITNMGKLFLVTNPKGEKKTPVGQVHKVKGARTSGGHTHDIKVEEHLGGNKVRGRIQSGPNAGMSHTGDIVEDKFKKGIVKAYTEDLNDLVEADIQKGGVGSGKRGHTTPKEFKISPKKHKEHVDYIVDAHTQANDHNENYDPEHHRKMLMGKDPFRVYQQYDELKEYLEFSAKARRAQKKYND